jgi:TonB family protein
MLANANPYAGAIPVNPFAREIAAVCDKHAVGHGSPGKLADFMRALDRNKHLAMDFWSLVVRISSEERGGSIDPDWLLAVIVEGVTGWNVASLRAAGTPETEHVTELASMLAGEDVHSPVLVHDENSRLVLEPEPPIPAASVPTLRPLEDDRPTAFRMAGYAETRSPGMILSRPAIVGFLLILSAAAGVVLLPHQNPSGWARLGDSIRARYTSTISALKLHREIEPAASAEPDHSSSAAVPVPGEAEPRSAIPTDYPDWTQPPPSAQVIPVEPLTPRKTAPAAIATINRAPRIASPPVAHATPNAAILVAVPEQSMKLHLISSRVPIYSAAATAAHATGPVVIKAIVTSRGAVEPLQVIEGDPALRRAALDAVSTWRYRPYLQDGVPIDVSTTISVDPPGSN